MRIINFLPLFAKTCLTSNHGNNPALCFPCIPAPEFLCILDLYFIINDIDPYGLVSFTFDYYPVPSCKLHHGAKASTEITSPEFRCRMCLRRHPADVCPAGTG